jgi:Xaa-Pro aminopeptidase
MDEQAPAGVDRRTDIDAKMARVADLLREVSCEGLLLARPENLAWLTSGASHRTVPDPASAPVIYATGDQRWLIASNADSQRIFDEEMDELGFQLKEWPWHWGREQLLRELFQNRSIASDVPIYSARVVEDRLASLRRKLTDYEQACMVVLGQIIGHALEATARNFNQGETERELAGQVSHRLVHRGIFPVHVGVAADGRSRIYRQFSYTSTPVRKYAVLTATGRKYGLHATASRIVSLGPVDNDLKEAHNTACRVSASYLASTWPDAVPRDVLKATQRIYQVCNHEHEWMLVPQGYVTGRLPVEMLFTSSTDQLLQPGWAVVWHASAGPACSSDTFLVTDQGPRTVTTPEVWPVKRIRIQGAEFVRPDVLER